MDLRLTGISGSYAGRSAVLKPQHEVTIGRAPDANIPFPNDQRMSRIHVKMFFNQGSWYVVDLASSNGTFISGQRLGPAPVAITKPVEMTVGSQLFRLEPFQLHAPGVTPPPPKASPKPQALLPLPAAAPRPWGPGRKSAVATYERGLLASMEDGHITSDEAHELKRVQLNLGLADKDTYPSRCKAAIGLCKWAMPFLTGKPDQVEAVEHSFEMLGVDPYLDPGVADAYVWLVCAHWDAILRSGAMPPLDPSTCPVRLFPGESAFFLMSVTLLEEHVVNQGYVSGHAGISFPIARGVYFNTGASRGQYVSERADIPVAEGPLILTSMRAVFFGRQKTIDLPWSNVLGAEPYSDGIQFFVSNLSRPVFFAYPHPAYAELVARLCSILLG